MPRITPRKYKIKTKAQSFKKKGKKKQKKTRSRYYQQRLKKKNFNEIRKMRGMKNDDVMKRLMVLPKKSKKKWQCWKKLNSHEVQNKKKKVYTEIQVRKISHY